MIGVYIHSGYVVACVCGCDCSCVYMCVVVGGCILCGCVSTCGSQRWVSFFRSHSSCFPRQSLIGLECAEWEKAGRPMKPRNTLPQHWDHKQIPHAQLFTRVLGTECKPSYWQGKHYQRNIVPVQRLLGSSGIRLYKMLMCDVSLDSIYW